MPNDQDFDELLSKTFIKTLRDTGDTLDYHKRGLICVLVAVLENKELSLELLKAFHQSAVQSEIELPNPHYNSQMANSRYASPEVREKTIKQKVLNEFRNDIVGAPLSQDITEGAVSEIINLIKLETDFEQYQGTWLGPDNGRGQLDVSKSIRQDTVSKMQQSQSNAEFARSIFNNIKNRKWHILYPRASERKTIRESLEDEVRITLQTYNERKSQCKDEHEKITLIVQRVQYCLRRHPFSVGNHRVLILGLLNFMLIKENIGFFCLQDRRQFILKSLEESVKIVEENLFRFSSKQTNSKDFCSQLLIKLDNKEAEEYCSKLIASVPSARNSTCHHSLPSPVQNVSLVPIDKIIVIKPDIDLKNKNKASTFIHIHNALYQCTLWPKWSDVQDKMHCVNLDDRLSVSNFLNEVDTHVQSNKESRSASVLNIINEVTKTISSEKSSDLVADAPNLTPSQKSVLFKRVHAHCYQSGFFSFFHKTHLPDFKTFDELTQYVNSNQKTRSATIYKALFN